MTFERIFRLKGWESAKWKTEIEQHCSPQLNGPCQTFKESERYVLELNFIDLYVFVRYR